ncbi:MAG: Sapep family Mn(2+)-dependent dipeptidase [Clostridia bacterium]
MLFGEKILDYWDDILKDLEKIIAVPSVCSEADGIYPFGKNAAKAVDVAMDLAQGYGLTAKNVDYYACHAEIGEGEENAIVMAHLDVVPEGEGWHTDPYTFTIDGNLAYGRGVSDNKGPAIVALHCLRALKDAGVVGKRKLRVVMGSAEEIGMKDMDYYFEREQHPTMGFTPDAGYGVCNCEKGIMRFLASAKNDGNIIKTFKSGTVVNAVPYKAECEIICTESELEILQESAYKLDGEYVITTTETGATILSKGIAGHASRPETGRNAATYLVNLLHSVFGDKIGTLATYVQKNIGFSLNGSIIGVACQDEPSGALTFNLGLMNINESTCNFDVDIRYPVTFDGNKILATIKSSLDANGLTLEDCDYQAPLYLPSDSDFIKLLTSSYEDVTGNECDVFSMGGGTYARTMFNKGVAFGAGFRTFNSNAHNCNEVIDLDDLKLHAKICLEAMYRMYTA